MRQLSALNNTTGSSGPIPSFNGSNPPPGFGATGRSGNRATALKPPRRIRPTADIAVVGGGAPPNGVVLPPIRSATPLEEEPATAAGGEAPDREGGMTPQEKELADLEAELAELEAMEKTIAECVGPRASH